jgi:hypothetical protein
MAAARTYTDPAQQSGTFHTLSRISWRTRCLLDEESFKCFLQLG